MRINSLRMKLMSAFVIVALISVVVGLFGLHATTQLNVYLKDTSENLLPSVKALSSLRFGFANAQRFTNRAIVDAMSHDRDGIMRARAQQESALRDGEVGWKEYEKYPMQPYEAVAWREFVTAYHEWRPQNDAVWSSLDAGESKKAAEIMETTANAAGVAAMTKLNRVIDIQGEIADRWNKEGVETLASAIRTLWTSIVCGLVTAIALGFLLTRTISGPIETMRIAAAKIAVGDIQQRIEHKSGDEIGDLAESFRGAIDYIKSIAVSAEALGKGDLGVEVTPRSADDLLSRNFARMVGALRGVLSETQVLIGAAQAGTLERRGDASRFEGGYAELIRGLNQMLEAVERPVTEASRVLSRLSERDLTARAKGDFQGEYGRMMAALNTAAKTLDESLMQVAAAAEQVASASSQIASSSQSVAQGASEQASAIEETSSTLVEMATTTRRNADNAQQANGLAQGAESASAAGATAMSQMMDAMGKIRAATEGTAAIIRDINEIAFQTNLLALNAAVEAARAGEAGRGFSVVAEEVRSLARRSKEAAKQTETLIGESMALSQQGEDISKSVSVSLRQIVEAVGKVTGIVGGIARASEEQRLGIEQVNTAVSQMDSVTQQAAASSEESSSAAEELAGQAHELASLVAQFQLHTARSSASRQPVHRPAAQRSSRVSRSIRPPATRSKRTEESAQGARGRNGHASPESVLPLESDFDFKDF